MIRFGEGRVSIIGPNGERREVATLIDISIDTSEVSSAVRRASHGMREFSAALRLLYGGPQRQQVERVRQGKRIARKRMKLAQQKRREYVADLGYYGPRVLRKAKKDARRIFLRNP